MATVGLLQSPEPADESALAHPAPPSGFAAQGAAAGMSSAGTPSKPSLSIQRSLTFRDPAEAIIAAWCDPAAQAHILEGAARPDGHVDGASLWRLQAAFGPSPQVHLRLESRDHGTARHRVDGDDGFRLLSELSTAPGPGGTAVTLQVCFQPGGLLDRAPPQVDPTPVLLAGQALRRLRAWLETARESAAADSAGRG